VVTHHTLRKSAVRQVDVWVRNALSASVTLIGVAAGVFLVWQASDALMLILVSIVAAVALSGAADGLSTYTGASRQWSLLSVLIFIVAAIAIGVWFGGATLLDQFQSYVRSVRGIVMAAQDFIERGAGGLFPAGTVAVNEVMPRFAAVFNSATWLLTAVTGGVLNAVLIAFLASFLAWHPGAYTSGLLRLIPPARRSDVGNALTRAGRAVRMWLLGQSVSMVVIFAASLIALWAVEMPYAILLAFLAGILTFVPTIGPVIAGIAITLAGFSASVTMGLYGLALYVAIQFIETYIITPIVQKEAVHLPPAATLGAQLIGGVLLGPLGFAFAVPLAAALSALVLSLYVEPNEHRASVAAE